MTEQTCKLFDVLGLATFALAVALTFAHLVDFCIIRQHRNGRTTPWIQFWASLTLTLSMGMIGRLERVTDFWPGVDLAFYLQRLQWIPNLVLVSSLWKLFQRQHFGIKEDHDEH